MVAVAAAPTCLGVEMPTSGALKYPPPLLAIETDCTDVVETRIEVPAAPLPLELWNVTRGASVYPHPAFVRLMDITLPVCPSHPT